jgi:hypothetical protein
MITATAALAAPAMPVAAVGMLVASLAITKHSDESRALGEAAFRACALTRAGIAGATVGACGCKRKLRGA